MIMADNLETRLRKLLENFTYPSSLRAERKSLMEHHIVALMDDLVPFIENEIADAKYEYMTANDRPGGEE